jgi:hypothetical protein
MDVTCDPTDTLQASCMYRIIAATAILNDAILITADKKLLAWRHLLKRQDAEC